MTDTVETAIYKLDVVGPEKFDQAAKSVDNLGAAEDRLAVKTETVTRAKRTTTDALDRWLGSMDKATRAQQVYQAGLDRVARYEQEGVGTKDQLARATDLVTQRYNAQVTQLAAVQTAQRNHTGAVNDNTGALRSLATATKLTYTEAEILRSGLVNTVQSLAAGMGAARTLETQLFQTAPAFGALARAMGGLGTVAVVGGLAAIAGGLALIFTRANQAETQLRSFRVILQATGNLQSGTPQDLLSLSRQLRDTGSSTTDAQALATATARTPGINPASYSTLANLARDIGAGTGQEATAVIASLEKALLGGADAATKFVYDLAGPQGLTAAEAANMRAMEAHGDRAGAVATAIDALQRRFGGEFKQSLSDTTDSINTITSAWNDMLDKLGDTHFVQAARDAVIGMLKGISQAASEGPSAANPMSYGAAFLPFIGMLGAAAGFPKVVGSGAGALWNSLPSTGDPAANQRDLADALATRNDGLQVGGVVTAGLIRSIIQVESGGNPNAVSPAGAQGLMQLMPGTAAGLGVTNPFDAGQNVSAGTQYIQSLVTKYGDVQTALMAYNWGPGNVDKYLAGQKQLPVSVRNYASTVMAGANRLSVSPDLFSGAGLVGGGTVSNAVSQQDLDALDKAKEQFDKASAAARKFGDDNLYAKTYVDSLAASSLTGDAKIYEAEQKASQAVETHRIELQKASTIQDLTTKGVLATADAYATDEVGGLRAAATAQAELSVKQGQALDVQSKATEILRAGAAEAVDAGAKALQPLIQQAAASQRLADAAAKGSAAEHEAELQNQATAVTHDALTKAIASGDPALVSRAQKLQDMTLAQIKANDAATQARAINDSINQRSDQVAVAQLQTGLQGSTPEQIQAATALLQEQQRLRNANVPLSGDVAKNDLASVDALSKANIQLADATRNQQRLDDAFRNVADTIDSTIGQAIQTIFDPTRVTDWAQTIKQVLGSLTSQLLDSFLIKPALGSLAGILGFGNTGIDPDWWTP